MSEPINTYYDPLDAYFKADVLDFIAATEALRTPSAYHLLSPLQKSLLLVLREMHKPAPPRKPRRRPVRQLKIPPNDPCFSDPAVARCILERVRWPEQVRCPHCGADRATHLWPREKSRRPVRPGVWKCLACRRQFTVATGTPLERSHVPPHKWLLALAVYETNRRRIPATALAPVLKISRRAAGVLLSHIRAACARRIGPCSLLTFRDHIAAVVCSVS